MDNTQNGNESDNSNGRMRRPARRTANIQPQPGSPPPAAATACTIEKPQVGMKAIKEFLEKKKDVIARAINRTSALTADGLVQNALLHVSLSKELKMSEPYYVLVACLAAAQIGLDFCGDLAYLVPYRMTKPDPAGGGERVFAGWKATFMAGYRGLVTVAGRCGYFLDAHEVCENDVYVCRAGTRNEIEHEIPVSGRGRVLAAYCVVRNSNGAVMKLEPVSREDLEAIRSCANRDSQAWAKWPGQMAAKSAAKRGFKWVPKDRADARLLAAVESRLDHDQDIADLVQTAAGENPSSEPVGS